MTFTSTSLPLQLLDAFRLFTLSPEPYRAYWADQTGENGILLLGLAEAVELGDDNFFNELSGLVTGDGLQRAIEFYYSLTECDFVDSDRLARNVRALVSSARLAAAILHGVDEDRILTIGQAAVTSFFENGGRSVRVPSEAECEGDAEDPAAALVEKCFRRLGRRGQYCLAARSWTLFWMDRQGDIEGASTGDIPVISTTATGKARLTSLSLTLLHDYEPSGRPLTELVEHPQTALLPLDSCLVEGLRRAWLGTGSPPSRWKLSGFSGPQRDDSLSGAAAVAFRHLQVGQQYNPECLVVASVGHSGTTLERVEDEPQKISDASRDPNIKVVIHSSRPKRILGDGMRGGEHLTSPHESRGALQVRKAGTVEEAFDLTWVLSGSPDQRVAYLEHYRPLKELKVIDSDYHYLTRFRRHSDDEEAEGLLRVRAFNGERPPEVIRLLWDLDLRTLYRISSSPATEDCLLQLHDSGADYKNGALVTVFRSSSEGYQTLEDALASRDAVTWLKNSSLRDLSRRTALWKAIRLMGQGVSILHGQNVMHRNLTADSIFLRLEDNSLESWRLGGFELSSYLLSQRLNRQGGAGKNTGRDRQNNWGVPPECAGPKPEPYTFEHDWYGLGMLAARIFLSLTFPKHADPVVLNGSALRKAADPAVHINSYERDFIRSLITPKREDRLKDWTLILRRLDALIGNLGEASATTYRRNGLAVVIQLSDEALREALRHNGYQLPTEMEWNSRSGDHKEQLREAVRQAINGANVYLESGGKYAAVKGGLILRLKPFKRDRFSQEPENWDFAYVGGVEQKITPAKSISPTSLEGEDIDVILNAEARRRLAGRSWESVLPGRERPDDLPPILSQFHSFLTLMNECELLLRAAEIFPCRVEQLTEGEAGRQVLRIFPREDDRSLPEWCLPQDNLIKFLYDVQANREDLGALKVYLTPDDSLRVHPDYWNAPWEVDQIAQQQDHIDLYRERNADNVPPPNNPLFLRLTDHWGQVQLIRRRKKAIDNLRQHTFLLKALVKPYEVVMEPYIRELPHHLDEKKDRVDDKKLAVLRDILAARPIYALQGPPGTGKTTLVAQLLRQILEEDPVAQILVTSQAHPAVNVLMERVLREGFFGERVPTIVRLRSEVNFGQPEQGTPEHEVRRILKEAAERLTQKPLGTTLEQEWLEVVEGLNAGIPSESLYLSQLRGDLRRLVKRSANITFSTTSDGELEDLADQMLSYDWSIIEEAGRAHGFDLALPLQAGHRWMLLGDQAQLTPYRHAFFNDCISEIIKTIKALESLTAGGAGLVDRINLQRVERRLDADSGAIRKEADTYLKTFEEVHNRLTKAQGKKLVTEGDQPCGGNAGRLTRNYRMHPTIGTLISETFYRNKYDVKIENATAEPGSDTPKLEFVHHLTHPAALAQKPIAWVDVPYRATRAGEEAYHEDTEENYDSEVEADIVVSLLQELLKNPAPGASTKDAQSLSGDFQADPFTTEAPPGPESRERKVVSLSILSPYARQRDRITKRVRDAGITLEDGWLRFRAGLRGRRLGRSPVAHTVDSFQGNEAQIVIVSLVRNNFIPPNDRLSALGFLKEKERLNVMLSRAEHLLILVGSWEFFTTQLVTVDRQSTLAGEMRRLFEHLEGLFIKKQAVFLDHQTFAPAIRPGPSLRRES